MSARLLALVLLAGAALAQDERRVTSPNGQVELRLFVAVQEGSALSRLAYEVFFRGQALVNTSFLGLDILNQEPLLGENVGLTSSKLTKNSGYNSLLAKYMQNGSLGRLIDIEARAYNDGVAFRYLIPPSTPLTDITIAEETTEFRFAQEIGKGPVVDITESKSGDYPAMHLTQTDPASMLTRLDRPFQTSAPFASRWRIISIGPDRGRFLLMLRLPGR